MIKYLAPRPIYCLKSLNVMFTGNLSTNGAVMVNHGQPYSLVATKFIEFSKCFLGIEKNII